MVRSLAFSILAVLKGRELVLFFLGLPHLQYFLGFLAVPSTTEEEGAHGLLEALIQLSEQ